MFQAAAAFVEKEYGGLDLLINSAGMLHPSGRGETSLKDVTFQVRSFIMLTRPYYLDPMNHTVI